MNTISETEVPKESILFEYIDDVDYKDCFSFSISNNDYSMKELYVSIFSSAPKWVERLMKFRNRLVSLIGLKTEMKEHQNSDFKIGDKVGIFKIYEIKDDEIIAGEDDKHLDFRVSIYKKTEEETSIFISTAVHYNNWFGRLYMRIIRPFHKIIVKSLIRKAAKKLSVST